MEPTKDNGQNKTEQLVPFTPKELFEAEQNARHCVRAFEDTISPCLEQITPSLIRAFHDFSRLSKGETIMDCRNQQEWAQKYFKRTARAIRYMISTNEEKEERKSIERDRQRRKRLAAPMPEQVKVEILPTITEGQAFLEIAATVQAEIIEKQTTALENQEREELKVRLQHDDDFFASVEPATPEPSHRDSLQKAQADLSVAKQWIRELQTLIRVAAPKKDCWPYLSDEDRTKWDKYVEREP